MRPIGARLLKSAIDTLRPEIADCHVLELFAGQGRFGFECLEEGASSVTFVEKHPALAKELKSKSASISVQQCDAFKYLESAEKKFELVFADPPFEDWDSAWISRFFPLVFRVLKTGSILLVKCPSRMLVLPKFKELSLRKETIVGESKLLYFTYGEEKP